MTGGASVEETLELWGRSLRSAKERIVPLFTQKRVADSACSFLDRLCCRKTGKVESSLLAVSDEQAEAHAPPNDELVQL